VCRLHSSHAYYTHCRSAWASTSTAQLCVVYVYLRIHSLTHVLTYSWPLLELALLGLGPVALSSLQLACTPPLQLGTRLLRVALVNHSLPPSTACVGYV
jgi:hypothetical protein